jgi:predicted TIM-barrel fold metal-dependent hydrolase
MSSCLRTRFAISIDVQTEDKYAPDNGGYNYRRLGAAGAASWAGSTPGRPVPYLDEVALTFPELRIVAGHIGHPWTEEMVGLAWKHENIYIDTSAYLPRYYPQPLLQFLKSYGKSKVLFGTNFPQLPFEKCVEQARALDLPEDARSAFFHENARRVFKLD